MHNKHVKIKYKSSTIKIKNNEFWYFKRLIGTVRHFYNKRKNFNKIILLKIPGTGEFIKVKKDDCMKIDQSIKNRIKTYENNLSK